MKIKITTTHEQEYDVPVPCFAKRDVHDYYAILNEQTAINVFRLSGCTMIRNTDLNYNLEDAAKAWITGTKITEEEFLEFHNAALESLSLTPKLTTNE